ncbi:MAG: M20/M25/M40 family metallo-hydrolase [Propionicimonas sp.]|uniref:M20/M25/M40 family metallo-hydrolase n=1 Tax=Propionicimonas sp. TaxID=1955623 RepID=UPI003D12FA5C
MELAAAGAAVRASLDPDALVADLVALVQRETPSHDAAASAGIAGHLAGLWQPFGAVSAVEAPIGTHLVVAVPGTPGRQDAAPVVLLGHSDTVWPVGTLDGAVPLVVEDGVLRGPGSYDMKAGLVVMLAAVRALGELGLAHRPLRVVIAADEEVGSGSASALVREQCAGAAAVLGFESPHPDGALKVGRLGSTRLRLRVTGRESHAALDPDGGVSAIDELVDQLVELRRSVAAVSARHPGQVLFNVGALSGGGRTNVVPGAAEALIGFRFGTSAAETEVLDAVSALSPLRVGAVLEAEVLSSRPAWQASDADAALLGRVSALAAEVGLEASGRPAAGAADTNTSGALGIPTLDGFGPRGGGAHAVTEHVLLDSLADRVVLLATVLTGL